jgi:hypothetical protein
MKPGAMGRILRRGAIALAALICICAAPHRLCRDLLP